MGRDLLGEPVTRYLALVLIAVQAGVAVAGQPDWIYDIFGLSWDGILAGRLWQPFTHALVHGPWWTYWWHLALNLICLMMVGGRVERIGGARILLKTLGAGVLGGAVLQMLSSSVPFPLIGASGGLFAAMFWLLTIHADDRMWPVRLKGRNLAIGIFIAEAGILAAAWMLPGSGLEKIGSGCHLGGAAAGWYLGRKSLGPRLTKEDLMRERERREGALQEKEKGPSAHGERAP